MLRELWQEEGLTQREIANRVGVLEPTMVGTIDALERAGMIVRERSTTDRRKTHVQLTPRRAQAARHAARLCRRDVLEHALTGISDAEIAELRDILKRIKKNLV